MGELDLFIDDRMKSFVINSDMTVSPSFNTDLVIALDKNTMMCLIESKVEDDSGAPRQQNPQDEHKICYFTNFKVPDFVPFRREFKLGSNKVILEKLLERLNYD